MKADYLSPKQVAALFGVHQATVLRWLQTGALRGFRLGRRYLIRPEDARAMLAPVEPACRPAPERQGVTT